MTPEERHLRVEWLGSLGVPERFHDAIIDAPNSKLSGGWGAVLGLAMLAAAVGVMVPAFMWLDGHVQSRAVAVATQNGATLTHVNVGIGPLLLFFGLLTLMGWVGGVLSARYRVNGFLSSAAEMLNSSPSPGLTRRAMHWILGGSVHRAGSRSTTVDEFLRAMAGDQARRWGMAAIVLLLPAVPLMALETNSFWVAGPSGIVVHSMLPPFSSRRYDLSDARVLTTGCNRTDKSNHLIYDVRLSSGERFDLAGTRSLKGSKIGAIEEIDAKIDPKIEHKRWSHLNRDPVHPTCLYHWAGQFDRDGQRRLAKLLRLTADEATGIR